MRVGIDLGTTNTVVSYIDENGIWKLLEFQNAGRREAPCFLPSCLAVRNGTIIVGREALEYGCNHPDEFLCNTKYYMGDPGKHYAVGQYMTPVKVAEAILKEVYCELQRQFPSESVFNAFVTVPARFGNEARQATKSALHSAGFEVTAGECLTDEPIAAAVAYSSALDGDKLVLVVDIGGGTFDLSLIKASIIGSAVHPDRLEPVAWDGDLHLGGNDIDDILIRKMAEKFMQDGGKYLYPCDAVFPREEETRASALLREQALELKKQLYAPDAQKASVYIPDLLDGIALDFSISTDEYISSMSELTARFSRCLQNLYTGSGYTPGDTSHVLVVGGMAHELCLQNILRQMFGEQAVIVPENAMLLVSKGASVCNSNQKLHVENKAYTSIGLLKNSRTAVQPVIREGAVIHSGEVLTASLFPESEQATIVNLELVEYRGEFHIGTCSTILRCPIPVTAPGKQKNLLDKLLGRKKCPELKLHAVFTEDKILKLTVTQSDGSEKKIDVRLGGAN